MKAAWKDLTIDVHFFIPVFLCKTLPQVAREW